jgi:hypothetical protein
MQPEEAGRRGKGMEHEEHSMRLLLLTLIVPLIALAGPPVHAVRWVVPERFLISFWCAPPPGETTLERYQEIAGAGFNAVLPPCAGPITPELNRRILELCAQTGLKAIVSDPRLGSGDERTGSSGLDATLDTVVADYAKSPALLGYFLGDEPSAGQFPRLALLDNGLRARDPKHLPYVNLFPNYATAAQLGTTTYPAYVRQFLETVRPKLLSFDHYALVGPGERPTYFENLEVIRRETLRAEVPFSAILLATPHGPYRDPSEADLRWQVYTSLAYGARGILYFTYWTPRDETWHFHNGILDERGHRTAHYEPVRRLNGELNALAPTLVRLRSTGVYHTGGLPIGTSSLPAGGTVREVRGGEAVVGLFREPRRVRIGFNMAVPPEPEYLLLVNRDPRQPVRLRVSLRPEITGIAEISRRSGREGRPELPDGIPDNVFNLRLDPGDGRLFALIERPREGWPTPRRGVGVSIGGVSVGR